MTDGRISVKAGDNYLLGQRYPDTKFCVRRLVYPDTKFFVFKDLSIRTQKSGIMDVFSRVFTCFPLCSITCLFEHKMALGYINDKTYKYTIHGGQNDIHSRLWFIIMDPDFESGLWIQDYGSGIMDPDYGLGIMDPDYGSELWIRIMDLDSDYGFGLWTRIMDPDYGSGLWIRIMDPDNGSGLWIRIMDSD